MQCSNLCLIPFSTSVRINPYETRMYIPIGNCDLLTDLPVVFLRKVTIVQQYEVRCNMPDASYDESGRRFGLCEYMYK